MNYFSPLYSSLTFGGNWGCGKQARTIMLSKRVRITLDSKLGYPRLVAHIRRYNAKPTTLYLMTQRNTEFDRLQRNLSEACHEVAEDLRDELMINDELKQLIDDAGWRTSVENAVLVWDALPLLNWVKQVLPEDMEPERYLAPFDYSRDDHRDIELCPLKGEKRRVIELWPQLQVLLDQHERFDRLSLVLYYEKGVVEHFTLATTLDACPAKAEARARHAIGVYQDSLHDFPDELLARIPWQQWLDTLLAAGAGKPKQGPLPTHDDILTIEPTKGRRNVDSLARWAISPSVALAYLNRFDAPALYLITRDKPHVKKLSRERIGSLPLKLTTSLVSTIVGAVTRDMQDPRLDHGDYSKVLIGSKGLGNRITNAEITRLIKELPLEKMITLYDKATLCMRLNGHRQRLHPEMDQGMRWITHVGPSSLTATEDAWWVLVPNSEKPSQGQGSVFPWRADKEAALEQAMEWRDQHIFNDRHILLDKEWAARKKKVTMQMTIGAET